jgi:sigma-B regulation protein RsbU (phosphoserine phosphatase)
MDLVSYRYWRRRVALFWPTSVVGKLALYFGAVWAVLAGVRYATLWVTGADKASGLAALIGISRLGTVLFACVLLLRWVRNRFLWKLSNRLIVTYFFIGVVPVALVITISLLAAALFLNQFATSEASSILDAEVRAIAAVGENMAQEIAHENSSNLAGLAETHSLATRYPGFELVAWKNGKSVSTSKISFPAWSKSDSAGVIEDGGRIFLRSITQVHVKADNFVVVMSVPITQHLLDQSRLGEITMFIPQVTGKKGGGVQITLRNDKDQRDVNYDIAPYVTGGRVPPAKNWWDRAWNSTSLITYRNWSSGEEVPGGVRVNTRASVLINELFSHQGEFAAVALIILGATAMFFAIIVLVAIIIGVRLTRTITYAVYRLYQATQHINRGEFRHRIQVKSNDQLAALQKSFNSMSESLEQLIAEQKIKQRLENELAIAQEVQETLFPRTDVRLETLELYGICKPARTVSGDYYDFIAGPSGSEQLTLAVGDISGKGISAALLMATVHSAVRAYQYGQLPAIEQVGKVAIAGVAHVRAESTRGVLAPSEIQSPADVLELLNRHLYQSTQPEKYATMFLSVWDGPSRTLTYSNAGHLPPIIISDNGSARRLEEGGMVIGLFDQMVYEERALELRPNDIFVAFSDGVTEPENEFGEFGEQRLIEIILENRHLPLPRIAEAVIAAVQDWIGANEQPDDITIVLARAR